MILYAALIEVAAYRSLRTVERLRAVLAAPGTPIEAMRAHAKDWLGQLSGGGVDSSAVARSLEGAGTAAEVRGILRSRVAVPLRETAAGLGRRAAVEGATLVAIYPHPAWDGLIARAWVADHPPGGGALRPADGPGRYDCPAAAGGLDGGWTTGLSMVSQGLADHVLASLPVVKHVAGALPGTGVVAVRLYRLGGVTAEACCPVPG